MAGGYGKWSCSYGGPGKVYVEFFPYHLDVSVLGRLLPENPFLPSPNSRIQTISLQTHFSKAATAPTRNLRAHRSENAETSSPEP